MTGAIRTVHAEILQIRTHLRDANYGAALSAWGSAQRMLGMLVGMRGGDVETDIAGTMLEDLGRRLRKLIERPSA